MKAFVYRSAKRADTYVWLAARDDFAVLPAALRERLGALAFALEVELDESRRLPREDAAVVRRNLAQQGWHVQLPELPLPPVGRA